MKKSTVFLLIAILIFSLSCQTLLPSSAPPRDGMVISTCKDTMTAFRALQTSEIPEALMSTGIKQGDEFDVNRYFDVMQNLSMQEGYALDYIYQSDSLGGYPMLTARPVDLPPYTSMLDVPENTELTNYLNYIEIKDGEPGYFEFAALAIMAEQFYLYWHAGYNDTTIVCNDNDVDTIVKDINDGDFGYEFDASQMRQIRAMNNIEPLVRLTSDTAIVELIVFSNWGGFYRTTFTIDRAFPHRMDVQEENIVPYDCGIMF